MKNKFFLNRHADLIFIMLGNECNNNCKYCLQHAMVEKALTKEINPDIYDFIEQVCNDLTDGSYLQLQFFGGEPLIYFENIKEIVVELNKRNLPIKYSCITNGKAITKEIVNFLNNNDFNVCVSWDGYHTNITRGIDVFKKESTTRDLLFQLNNVWISGVMCSYSYPAELADAFEELDHDYLKLRNKHLYMNVDDIMDMGEMPDDVINLDFNRISNEVRDMTKEFIDDLVNKRMPDGHYARNVYISERYNRLQNFYKKECNNEENRYKGMICCCGNGYSTYNLDLKGNLYPCHNTSIPAGTIYDPYFKYLSNIIATDTTRLRRNTCKDCSALYYCMGGCKMIPDNKREFYCKVKRAVAVPIIEELIKFNKGEDK